MNWYKPEKNKSTVCKEANNLDYEPNYEDIYDVEDLMQFYYCLKPTLIEAITWPWNPSVDSF